jgi:hypothetical protein
MILFRSSLAASLTGVRAGNVALQLVDGLLVGSDDPIHQITD